MVAVSRLCNPRTGPFWGQLSETEHAVQVYRDDTTFLDCLESFTAAGLRSGESVVLVATASHLHELEKRLRSGWIDLDRCRWEERYIAVLAQETLAKFMIDGAPDEELFHETLGDLIARARGRGRKLRAFGEMVGVLWAEGNKDGALKLEHFWTRLQAEHKFPLFCAYSRMHLRAGSLESDIQTICAAHTRIVPGYV
jgi:hypothetical protein